MSTISAFLIGRPDTVVHMTGNAIMRWWVAYTRWRIERLAIDRLGALSDRQLRDIGLVRSQIEFAVKGGRDTAAAVCPLERTR